MHFPGMRPVRKGDSTSHGGQVNAGLDSYLIEGKPIARVGDTVTCPKCGPTLIIQGHPAWTVNGKLVALHGHATSCGATLIASLPV